MKNLLVESTLFTGRSFIIVCSLPILVELKLEKPKHFSSNGHGVNDMKFFAIDVVKLKGDVFKLKASERYWIDKLCTITRGLNTNRTWPDHLLIAIIFKKLDLEKYSC